VGNAVKRNKVKRRIRAFFRENKFALNSKIIVIAKPISAHIKWSDFKTDILNLLKNINA
jgi:ribonuclease P protein component